MKKALVHDWFYTNAGGEKVVQSLTNVWTDFDYYTLIDTLTDKDRKDILKGAMSNTSFIQKLPTAKKNHRKFLQLFPLAIEGFDLSEYDVIISSSSAVAKGVLTNQNQLHICYCHSPMRYAWNLYFDYLKSKSLMRGVKGWYAKYVLYKIRQWDVVSSNRVDFFIANSNYIAQRIKKIYNREATVIYPPVDTDTFQLCVDKSDYFVAASRLVSYKKIELIVQAFNKLPNKKLIVIGEGPDKKKLQKIAKQNIKFEGKVSEEKMVILLQKAKALVFAADEDFGILPVEAQSCGTPVIAYKKGGLLETIIENKTGLFFNKQSELDIINAIKNFEEIKFSPQAIRENALRFSRQRFEREIKEFIEEKIKHFFGEKKIF
ncbi:Glycosyltransferase involved in cell wall bisynthesis [Tenacibaculum sp. MAR_2009_124]|uniref:glycosyltransferase n=1 Tax=Tenacibaculum sp. MAR_2009_124 TaxID=1250059 RepID=UPI00089B2E00|nr:glycosyltransferase [Tenacibaculum sp. MAR_2009_124]SEC48965.1 Glycosyltransferase involved in cell wall bisynthesis [Tenacibaculum sp. MAR_2009_124]